MKFFYALVTPTQPDNRPVNPVRAYFPTEAISSLEFLNASSYRVVIKQEYLRDFKFDVHHVEATLQSNSLKNHGIEFL